MSKALRLILIAMLGCVLQTNIVQYIRIAGVAPDMMIAILVAITSYCGLSGSFCTAAIMVMFYDASVGYVMALNLIGYVMIALATCASRMILNEKLKKWKHKSFLIMMMLAFFFTLTREVLYVGYLYLIGAEMGAMTVIRMFLCAGYTALMVIPAILMVRFIMNWHPIKNKKKQPDIEEPKRN